MNKGLEIRGSLLAKNTVLNFVGQVIPLFVAVVTIPYVIRGLGAERFGILSLAWVVLGYLSILDLGLGRATTKFVAEALGKGDVNHVPSIVWTSIIFVSLLGFIGGAVLFASTPLLIDHIFNVPPYLIHEAKTVFYIMSVSILVTLITATLSGVLEAYQRFDLVNAIRVPSNILSYIIPAVSLLFGASLPIIVLLLLMKNFYILLLYFFSSLMVMRPKRGFSSISLKVAPSLFNYGWWIALHNAAVAILLYLDRFLVGIFLTMSAVTYYTAPYELVSRGSIVPSSMMMVLFPAFSYMEAIDRERLQSLFNRALKYLILIMGLITGIVVVFSKEILLLWLGEKFAKESTFVLQIFAIGIFFSSLAWLSGTLLQGIGKPRVVTTIHILQVPIYILSTWLFIKVMNIEGAALSWSVRIILSLILLLFVCWKVGLFKPVFLLQNGSLKMAVVIGVISGTTIVVKSFIPFSAINLILVFVLFTVTLLIVIWNYTLRQEDKVFIINTVRSLNSVK